MRAVLTQLTECSNSALSPDVGCRYDAALEKAKYAALAMKQQAEDEVVGEHVPCRHKEAVYMLCNCQKCLCQFDQCVDPQASNVAE